MEWYWWILVVYVVGVVVFHIFFASAEYHKDESLFFFMISVFWLPFLIFLLWVAMKNLWLEFRSRVRVN